jgi:hypothetical protein
MLYAFPAGTTSYVKVCQFISNTPIYDALKTEDEHRCSGRVTLPAPVLKGQIFSSYFV